MRPGKRESLMTGSAPRPPVRAGGPPPARYATPAGPRVGMPPPPRSTAPPRAGVPPPPRCTASPRLGGPPQTHVRPAQSIRPPRPPLPRSAPPRQSQLPGNKPQSLVQGTKPIQGNIQQMIAMATKITGHMRHPSPR